MKGQTQESVIDKWALEFKGNLWCDMESDDDDAKSLDSTGQQWSRHVRKNLFGDDPPKPKQGVPKDDGFTLVGPPKVKKGSDAPFVASDHNSRTRGGSKCVCKVCGCSFIFPQHMVDKYKGLGWKNPRTCRDCKKNKG